MAFSQLGAWTHAVDVLPSNAKSMPPWRYVTESSISLAPGNFSNVALFDGQAIPTHPRPRLQELDHPRNDARIRFINVDGLMARPYVTAEWSDDRSQALRDLLLILIGASVGLAMTALFELLVLVLCGQAVPADVARPVVAPAPGDAVSHRKTRKYALFGVATVTTGLLLVSFFTLQERAASLSQAFSASATVRQSSAPLGSTPPGAANQSILGDSKDHDVPLSIDSELYRFDKIVTVIVTLGIVALLFVFFRMQAG
jgi:hypothetical protein